MPPSFLPLALAAVPLALLAAGTRIQEAHTGRKIFVLSFGGDAGLSGRVFALVLLTFLPVLVIAAAAPDRLRDVVGTVPFLDCPAIAWLGNAVLAAGGLLLLAAQRGMGGSWRVGIPAAQDAPLVTDGLFARSRNPAYLGFMLAGMGLFLAVPNALTLACGVALAVSLSYQVRLEEAHLRASFGSIFDAYAARVPRWI